MLNTFLMLCGHVLMCVCLCVFYLCAFSASRFLRNITDAAHSASHAYLDERSLTSMLRDTVSVDTDIKT